MPVTGSLYLARNQSNPTTKQGFSTSGTKAARLIIFFVECQSASFSMNCRRRDSTRTLQTSFCFLTQPRRNTKSMSTTGLKIVTNMTQWTIKISAERGLQCAEFPRRSDPAEDFKMSTRAHHSFQAVERVANLFGLITRLDLVCFTTARRRSASTLPVRSAYICLQAPNSRLMSVG